MTWKMRCCVGSMVVSLVVTITLLAFILSLHKENFFYCYFFDNTRFYKVNSMSKVKQLYSKMKIKQNERLAFDYVIVGAGTAGSVIADRLSENPDVSVLVIEAGKNMNGVAIKEIPGIAPFAWSNSYGDFTWDYSTTKQESMGNRRFKWPAGKMLGGTSSNNFMIYSQTFSKNYNQWSEVSGCENWSWDNVSDYFFQTQNSVAPVKATKLGRFWQEAWKDEPFKVQEDGMRFFINAGIRWDMTKEHLYTASKRPNVYVLTETFVKGIQFNQDGNLKRASSVEIDNRGETKNIFIKKDIILSAGTVQNVRILKESLLNNHDDSEIFIGKNLKDHLFVPLFFETLGSETYGYSTSVFSMIASFWQYLFSTESLFAQTMIDGGQVYFDTRVNNSNWTLIEFSPNIQVVLISSLIDEISLKAIFSKYLDPLAMDIYLKIVKKSSTNNGFTVFVILTEPVSEGFIDYKQNEFSINPKYLSQQQDIVTILHGLKRVLDVLHNSKAFKETKLNLLKPDSKDSDLIELCNQDELQAIEDITPHISDTNFNMKYWACYIKQVGHSIFHYHGSVSFGSSSKYPVDCNLKLRNTSNVHVADASVIPHPVSGGLQSVVMMIAEKFSKDFTSK